MVKKVEPTARSVQIVHRKRKYAANWNDPTTGKPCRKLYATKKMRDAAIAELENMLNPWASPFTSRSLADVLDEYDQNHLAALKAKTRTENRRILATFYQLLQARSDHLLGLDEIAPAHCDRWLVDRKAGLPLDVEGNPFIPGQMTVRKEIAAVKAFFNWCLERSYIDKSPAATIRKPPPVTRVELSAETREIMRLLEVLGDDEREKRGLNVEDPQGWYLLILLAWLTGVRQSVLLRTHFGIQVTRRNVTRIGQTQHLPPAVREPEAFGIVQLAQEPEDKGAGLLFSYTAKTFKEKPIGLPPLANDCIEQRISYLPAGMQYLFFWEHFQKLQWAKICSAANVNRTFHDLRGGCGMGVAIDQAIQAAQHALDHSSPRVTTDHYVQTVPLARRVAQEFPMPALPPLPTLELGPDDRPLRVRATRPPRRVSKRAGGRS